MNECFATSVEQWSKFLAQRFTCSDIPTTSSGVTCNGYSYLRYYSPLDFSPDYVVTRFVFIPVFLIGAIMRSVFWATLDSSFAERPFLLGPLNMTIDTGVIRGRSLEALL